MSKRRHKHQQRHQTSCRRKERNREPTDSEPGWMLVGDRLMFVIGFTPGGAPFGCYEDEFDDLEEESR